MNEIVPITSLTPTAALKRLIVDQIIELPDQTIYWFKKGGSGSGHWRSRGQMASGTDFAMLAVRRNSATFKVQYYPKEGDIQIVKELEMNQLPLIVNDLVQAGFPFHCLVPEKTSDRFPKPALPQGDIVGASPTETTNL